MAWEAGQYDFIWNQWVASGYPKRASGDQAWIAELVPNAVVWQTLFPSRLLSIKTECTGSEARTRWQHRWCAVKAQFFELPYPEGASIVYFHGQPKPDNCRSSWVREAWSG